MYRKYEILYVLVFKQMKTTSILFITNFQKIKKLVQILKRINKFIFKLIYTKIIMQKYID